MPPSITEMEAVEAMARAIRKAATGIDAFGLYPLEKWRDQARAALTAAEPFFAQARVDAIEEAAKVAECHSDDRGGRDRHFDWHDGYQDGCRGAATAIRSLSPAQGEGDDG
jgi:hypothetical protein